MPSQKNKPKKEPLTADDIRGIVREEIHTNLYWMLTYLDDIGMNPLKPKSHFLFGLDRDAVLLFLVSIALILQALTLLHFY